MHHHCGICSGVCLKARMGIIVFFCIIFLKKKLFALCFRRLIKTLRFGFKILNHDFFQQNLQNPDIFLLFYVMYCKQFDKQYKYINVEDKKNICKNT